MAGAQTPAADGPRTLEEARQRIRLLEQKLDEAIDLLVKRDAQLEARERRIMELEQQIDDARPPACS